MYQLLEKFRRGGRFGLYIRKRIPPPVKLAFQVGVLPSTSHKINFSNIFEKLIADLERAAKKIRMLKKEKSSLKNQTKNLESENAALIEQNENFVLKIQPLLIETNCLKMS